MRDRSGRVYTPAVGPRLRPLLWIILIGFALLGANGVYLSSVTSLTWLRGTTQQTPFYMLMIALHLVLGFFLIVPFLVFGLDLTWRPRGSGPTGRPSGSGWRCWASRYSILVSGLVLVRLGGFEIRDPRIRDAGYWLHVLTPLVAVALYVKHRLAGPRIRWEWARRLSVAVAGFVVVMGLLHFQDPRSFGVKGPREGKQYFYPSEAITANGKFIPARTLMMDDYCMKCHQDAYQGWFHSAHRFSSFNNPAYRASVRETRRVSLAADGSTQAARWCAGCHDPVPFFSGEFDDPNYDDVNNPTSQAGITCTTCHAITNINDTRGNAAYTIEEPEHYPFAFSDDPLLQWINNSLVKAKPEMHKKTFFKPILKDAQVLLDLPQGRLAGRRHPLQGFRPRPEPLRHLSLLGRLGPRRPQLLLPGSGQVELQRVPHGAEALDRLRRQGFRRQGGPRRSTITCSRRQHRPGRLAGKQGAGANGTPAS